MLIKIIFNIEIKLLVKCKSYVTKVVGFDLRIPKNFSLHFSDFSTILYGIYNFVVFRVFLQIRPRSFVSSHRRSLAVWTEQGRGLRGVFRRGPLPAARGKLGKREWGSRRTFG